MRPSVRRVRESAVSVALWAVAAMVASLLLWMIAYLLRLGFSQISVAFLTEAPAAAGRSGGIAPMLLSNALILLTSLIAVPIAAP